MKIARLVIRGDHRAIGRALGEAMAPAIRDVLPRIASVRNLMARWRGSPRVAAMAAAARQAYPQYLLEIEGIAEGAGVPFEDILIWNCRGDLPESPEEKEAGCTSLMIAESRGALRMIAHNEDGEAALDGHCALVEVAPDKGLPFTAFVYPGMLPGNAFGFNAGGLVQAINHVSPRDRRIGISRHIICRAILGVESLDAALEILQRRDRAGGFHHNLGEVRSGRMLSVEAPPNGCAWHEIKTGSAHANHLVFEELIGTAQRISASSRDRQLRAEALVKKAPASADVLLAILADDRPELMPILRKGQRPEDDGFTLATALFAMRNGTLEWQVHAHPAEAPLYHGTLAL